jgi:hypothetical protein
MIQITVLFYGGMLEIFSGKKKRMQDIQTDPKPIATANPDEL